MEVAGSVCAVTGAGGGLGRQVTLGLARAGARVFGCDLSDQSFSAIEELAVRERLDIRLAVCDVTDEGSVIHFFETIAEAAGAIGAGSRTSS